MNQEARILLDILRAFFEKKVLEQETMCQFKEMLEQVIYQSKIHNVSGIVAYKVKEYFGINQPENEEDVELLQIMTKVFLLTVQRSALCEKKYQELSEKLTKEHIDHLAFKGIVVKNFYAVPELRTFGDVDFAIRKEDRDRSHELIQKMGYGVKYGFGPVYTYKKEQELYEVHTSIMAVNVTERADYIGYFSNFWEYAKKTDNEYVYEFTPEFHFTYLFSHVVKHINGYGAGIRMYMDLAFYIKNQGKDMNWDFVKSELEKLELSQFFHLSMYSIKRWFKMELPFEIPEVDDNLLQEFEIYTMEAGVFGFEGRKMGEVLVRNQSIAEKGVYKIKALQKVLFPNAKTIKARYTYLEKHPYLLPIAWIERVIKNRKKIDSKLRLSKDIMSVKKNDVEKKIAFYRKIGL